MKKVIFISGILVCFLNILVAQQSTFSNIHKPKLVIGIVVDQMRWDFLYRFEQRFAPSGGFKRLLAQGYNCEQAYIPYVPTVTAAGHASIYTGSVPAIHGIVGNSWNDKIAGRNMYCVEDSSVQSIGCNNNNGKMSPKNLWVTTISDELRLASNFKSKVIGISLKDRGAIISAGHCPNGAFWYDNKTGNFITSSFYAKELPQWVVLFNRRKIVDSLYTQTWNTLYKIDTYIQSTADDVPYENKILYSSPLKAFGKNTFPYYLMPYRGTDYSVISTTPYGNNLLLHFAKAAIEGEQLGKNIQSNYSDLLTISFSSTDYIGHAFGINSVEVEDTYLRLDKDLGELLDYLDNHIGKGQYTIFLTADHGGAHNQQFLKEHNIPSGVEPENKIMLQQLNDILFKKYNQIDLVKQYSNNFIFLNITKIDSLQLALKSIKQTLIDYLNLQPEIFSVVDETNLANATIPYYIMNMVKNGYTPKRCGNMLVIYKSGIVGYSEKLGSSHSKWYNYDSHIPLLFYGAGIKQGKLQRTVYMNDIIPTISALLNLQYPSGATGNVIAEVLK
ncbi:MAG: alkaline phosphatase PafA [Chitinophagaceae bacterium]